MSEFSKAIHRLTVECLNLSNTLIEVNLITQGTQIGKGKDGEGEGDYEYTAT